MDDIFCPFCHKGNPENVEVCQHCGNVLNIESGSINPATNLPKNQEQDSPTDFLAGLSQANDDKDDKDEFPEWLKNMQATISGPSEQEQEPEQLPDGLSFTDLGRESDVFTSDENIEPTDSTNEEIPAWLNTLNINDEAARSNSEVKVPAEETKEIPSASGDLPDWLSSLVGQTSEERLTQSSSVPTNQEAAQDEGVSELFSSLGGDFTDEENFLDAEADTVPSTEMPDWLTGSAVSKLSEQSAPIDGSTATDLPDWLAESTGSEAATDSQEALAQTSTPEMTPDEGDLPTWFKNLDNSTFIEDETTSEPQTSTAAETLPPDAFSGWMANLPGMAAETSNPEGSSIDAGLPSWLTDDMDETPEITPDTSREAFEIDSFNQLESGVSGSALPDWLRSEIAGASSQEPGLISPDEIIGETPPAQTETVSFDASNAGRETDSPILPSGAEQNIDSLLGMESADWLSGFSIDELEKKEVQAGEEPAIANLSPAELPSWVQALRPLESVITETSDVNDEMEVENQGPLAGIYSVLPALSELVETRKPKAYSIKLLVSDTQLSQAAFLENLIFSESKPQSVGKRSAALNGRWLRWVIAAVLFAALMVSAAISRSVFPAPLPPVGSGAVDSFIKTIRDLPESAPVLLVVDYQPGFAAELEAAAGPLFEQLFSKNAHLAFISTSPIGPFMADRLLQKFLPEHLYQAGSQHINLGYLPGGAGGIKVFAEQPALTLGQDILLGNMWTALALKDVTVNDKTELSNFRAVVVMTDNPDTGRLWIEQTQPSLKTTPLLMVVSAQTEPMIRPYFLSGQLKGLIAGLEGGMLYETALGLQGQARSYWDTFGVGILAAELLILFGGLWAFVTSLRAIFVEKEQVEA